MDAKATLYVEGQQITWISCIERDLKTIVGGVLPLIDSVHTKSN